MTGGGPWGFGPFADPACPMSGNPAEFEDEGDGYSRCRYNYQPEFAMISETERWALGLNSTIDLGDRMTLYIEAAYSENKTNPDHPASPLFWYFVDASHPNNPLGQGLFIHYRPLDIEKPT